MGFFVPIYMERISAQPGGGECLVLDPLLCSFRIKSFLWTSAHNWEVSSQIWDDRLQSASGSLRSSSTGRKCWMAPSGLGVTCYPMWKNSNIWLGINWSTGSNGGLVSWTELSWKGKLSICLLVCFTTLNYGHELQLVAESMTLSVEVTLWVYCMDSPLEIGLRALCFSDYAAMSCWCIVVQWI